VQRATKRVDDEIVDRTSETTSEILAHHPDVVRAKHAARPHEEENPTAGFVTETS
jgi:hypothetical protein